MQLIVVSGRSGSGKTVALRVLEDLGYYCVDNLPVNLLPQLIVSVESQCDKLAVSIDVRNLPSDPEKLELLLAQVRNERRVEFASFFFDADNGALLKRYGESRRLHPLSRNNLSLDEAIREETHLLAPLSSTADLRIDTTSLSIHELSEFIKTRVLGKKENELVLVFESFGFKYGIPKDADFVFDARFLPNPHWVPELKPFTGKDTPVINYLSQQADVMRFIQQIENMLVTWLPHLERNNRSYVTVGIGCTGGQHRSVFMVEHLANTFVQMGKNVQTRHRTLDKAAPHLELK
ncbi:RNase adapter RapZ [Aeromonas cavernicola]|uniref:RNase adapter RapZ n=1 Tax=Aeromonas cavernicola TaxID=1006623 RepID=A0A2H9U727_9GAMM|nr:RNase adapter RapZ [Aeromonas cavernicola]PJG59814.1 RNase adapter RapZ [Aeromonas cavernicola]